MDVLSHSVFLVCELRMHVVNKQATLRTSNTSKAYLLNYGYLQSFVKHVCIAYLYAPEVISALTCSRSS
jgi:hypothetical protein